MTPLRLVLTGGLLLPLLAPQANAATPTPEPSKGWVQVQVDDFNAKPADANYVLSYGRGSIGWRWSLNKDVFAFTSTWTEPPKVIVPGDRVEMRIGVAVTGNTGEEYSANGNLNVWFDRPDIEPGSAGNPIGFGNDKGEAGSIDVSHRRSTAGGSTQRDVWVDAGSLPTGSDGDRIALLVCAYNGRIAGTRYVYEWKTLPGSETPPPAPSQPPAPGGASSDEEGPTPTPASTPVPSSSPPVVSLTVGPTTLAADGEATAEVVFRYADDGGGPVGGVAVEWRLGPRLAPEELGSLVKSDPATGADGIARALYKAPVLEARNIQEIGERKGRDIAVDYRAGEEKGSRTATLTLLKTAPADLVVEKPGLPRSRLAIRIGSLNGSIQGTLNLRASHLPNSPSTSQEPLNDATVSLESPMLKWAAIGKTTSDEKGRFTIAMKMANWPRWDLSLREAILLEPDQEFTARQTRFASSLARWPASPAVKQQALLLASEAQVLLAGLKAPEARGLADKLQMAAWMLTLLKDGRGDATTAAGELLGHGWSLLRAAGEYFYADSRLQKTIDDKYRSIEAVKKIRGLQAQKARWMKSQADGTAVRDSLLGWLSRVVLARAPESSELQAGGRLRRSLLDKVLLAKLVEALADYVAGKVTDQIPKGWVPDVGGFLTQRLLQPYDDASNETVGLFLANADYARIHAVSTGVEVRLAARKAEMSREFERATQWRIAEDMAQALAANAAECSQLILNVLAVGYAAPKLADAAKYLEKVHKAIDAVATSARLAEECFTFSGILSRTSDTVLEAVAEAAGVPTRVVERGPAAPAQTLPGPTRWDLLPAAHAAEGLSLDLAAGIDWTAFAPREGQVPVQALGELALVGPAVADWQATNLVPLLAVAESDPEGMAALLARESEWREAVVGAQAMALESLGKPMGPAETVGWTTAVKALRERTDALQARIDAVARAAERLGPDPDAALREAIAEKQKAEAPVTSPVAQAGGRPWLLLAAAVGALAVGLLALGLILWRVLGRRTVEEPAALASPVEAVAPLAVPGALIDARGRAYSLDRECLTLGTAADNAVVLASNRASRHHARVWRTPEGTSWIEDLGSTNGTSVDGQRVERAWLQPGSVILLGDETLRVS